MVFELRFIYFHISHSATVLQTSIASDKSVLNVDGARCNPAASHWWFSWHGWRRWTSVYSNIHQESVSI